MIALNNTNGELVFSTLGTYIRSTAIAYGIMLSFNAYDNQVYAFGKGPTKITVEAPTVGVSTNTPITFTGTITDVGAGTTQNMVAARFPNGFPCVSDESMSKWMEYVYQQQPMPTDVKGVEITLNVVDSNGNYRTIGTTTSNAYGTYSFTWTPDISGDYTVMAKFAGSESYYQSSAATAFFASEPAATIAPQATQAPSAADLYFIPAIAGLFVAIVICIAMVA
jgi:hypothetical protein